MRFRNDLSIIPISLTSFQAFDHDKDIEETFPEEWDLQPEDRFNWQCAQFDGIAEVFSRHGNKYSIRKIR